MLAEAGAEAHNDGQLRTRVSEDFVHNKGERQVHAGHLMQMLTGIVSKHPCIFFASPLIFFPTCMQLRIMETQLDHHAVLAMLNLDLPSFFLEQQPPQALQAAITLRLPEILGVQLAGPPNALAQLGDALSARLARVVAPAVNNTAVRRNWSRQLNAAVQPFAVEPDEPVTPPPYPPSLPPTPHVLRMPNPSSSPARSSASRGGRMGQAGTDDKESLWRSVQYVDDWSVVSPGSSAGGSQRHARVSSSSARSSSAVPLAANPQQTPRAHRSSKNRDDDDDDDDDDAYEEVVGKAKGKGRR